MRDTIRVAERTQRALRAAMNEAKRAGSQVVTADHVLLGLLEDGAGVVGPGVVTAVLDSLGVDKDQLRRALQEEPGTASDSPGLEYAPEALAVLEAATQEARSLGHDWVGAEHLLLGVLQAKSRAADVCIQHGLATDRVRATIVELLGPTT